MVSEKKSMFTKAEIAGWNERARELNETARGDQSAWVLERA
jgi:hypothetical protein